MTTFVEYYHPALPGTPHIEVPLGSEGVYAAHGWVAVDGSTPAPDPIFLTPGNGDLRYARGLNVAAAATANAALAVNEHTPVDATGGAKTMTLPTGQAQGTVIIVEKVDTSANAVTISGSIRGSAATEQLTTQYEARSFIADSAGSWHPFSGHKTWTALKAAFVAPSKIAPAATGVAATDTANLQAAINATPSGGQLFIRSGLYALNAPLQVTRHITIEGESSSVAFAPRGQGITNYPPGPNYLTGTVLTQTAAGVDGIQISGSAVSANLHNIGVVFAGGLASTGHGINATPSATDPNGNPVGSHQSGPMSFEWRNVHVYGHDGNHYGFVLTNPMYGRIDHCYSYLGGGWLFVGDNLAENWGNLVLSDTYVVITQTGSAGGYMFNSGGTYPARGLNLMVFVRPQCNIMTPAATQGTQPLWNEHLGTSIPFHITVIGGDFETSGANPLLPGLFTQFLGDTASGQLNQQLTTLGVGALRQTDAQGLSGVAATAIGNQALAANTTGTSNTAVGGASLVANTTGARNTAVGNLAMNSITTASDATAVGAAALAANTTGGNTAVGSDAARKNTTGTSITAIGSFSLHENQAGNSNTAVGASALYSSTGTNNTAIGTQAGTAATTGWNNVFIGQQAGNGANPQTTAGNNTFIGYRSGLGTANQSSQATAIGYQALAGGTGNGQTAIGAGTSATGNGSVAIGCDNAGNSASATNANQFALGTALHQVQISNNTTGSGSAALGANCPATTATAPYTWFRMLSSDGSTVYVPAWK